MKKMVEVEVESPLEEINNFLSNKKLIKLFTTRPNRELMEYGKGDIPNIENLKCIEKINSNLFLVEKAMVSMYGKAQIKKNYIVSFPLNYLKLAIEMGFDTLYVYEKDYPCVCGISGTDEIMVIAPKVARGDD
jgi:hypothetical protein